MTTITQREGEQSDMNSIEASTVDQDHQSNYLVYLLVSLVFILLIVPVIDHSSIAAGLLRVGITAVLISAAVATRRRKAVLFLGLFGAFVAAPVSWLTMFVDTPGLFLASCILEGVFFVVMAVLILVAVMRRHLATVHSIFGAISAYLLLGLAWAVVYWGIDHVDEHALDISNRRAAEVVVRDRTTEVPEFSQFVYFSFVTMSTLGYGDIQPQTPITQTLAWMQSVTGQFYIAVLVAWLVSEIPKPSRKSASS